MKKKIVALLTVVTLMVTMFSITTFAEEYATSLSFTYTPVTRENIDTIIEAGNDVSSGDIKAWTFFKKGELKYFYDKNTGWGDSNLNKILKPENFDDIDQVMEKIEFSKTGVKYDVNTFTGVTANDVALVMSPNISFLTKPALGYSFYSPDHGEANRIDVYLLFNLNSDVTPSQSSESDNPNTADTNSALPYGCATVASLVLIVLSLRKIKLEKVNRNK